MSLLDSSGEVNMSLTEAKSSLLHICSISISGSCVDDLMPDLSCLSVCLSVSVSLTLFFRDLVDQMSTLSAWPILTSTDDLHIGCQRIGLALYALTGCLVHFW